ncbi:uncharacterized protein LOC116159923 [Photinus pyralis]|uniref:uncharacterized protein LOC116159923 n=1 Tax=Photinus pyralis TaxID=7054 RepID=UPI0012674F83|nr:uncharacterized protein LOC116159923 [Photinus pyralis]
MRDSIPAQSKLEVTLRFLATGETFRSLMYGCRIHESTISRFVPAVCNAIITVLTEKYINMPRIVEDWEKIAAEFDELWQFPHCLGALDGRHIQFRAPISQGSYFYNYKGNNSIVLLALVDANYIFRYVNIGVNGRISDGGVFNQSSLGIALKDCPETLNIPQPTYLPGQDVLTPYVIIADDAFPSLTNLIKPYSHKKLSFEDRVYNYRVSRARRMVESSFGILANRFRVLLQPINLNAEKVEIITLTCVLLHNYLATNNKKYYLNLEDSDKDTLQNIERQTGNRSSTQAREVRDNFRHFFNSNVGSVPWQNECVIKGNY